MLVVTLKGTGNTGFYVREGHVIYNFVMNKIILFYYSNKPSVDSPLKVPIGQDLHGCTPIPIAWGSGS